MCQLEPHQPVRELAIAVAKGTLVVRVNGVITCISRQFHVAGSMVTKVSDEYNQISPLAREPDRREEYQQRQEALGHLLGLILFQDASDAACSTQLGGALAECLDVAAREGGYVRLLLSFDVPCLGNLPWELTRWRWAGGEICLGSDERVTLSRFEHRRNGFRRREAFGRDGALSIFHIDPRKADLAVGDARALEFLLTRDFLRVIDDHVVRLHASSRSSNELQQYWRDSERIAGRLPEMDIVHWDSHGGNSLEFLDSDGKTSFIGPEKLLELTRSAFLYVIRACDTAGGPPHMANCPALDPASFGAALLAAGAPVVLGTHGIVEPGEFAHLPMLYPLMFQGLPLDYCVQFVRRLLADIDGKRQGGPHDRWYKLILQTTSTWYLDAAPADAPFVPCDEPTRVVELLGEKFEECKRAVRDAEAARRADGAARAQTLADAVIASIPDDASRVIRESATMASISEGAGGAHILMSAKTASIPEGGRARPFWDEDFDLPRQIVETYRPK